MGIAVTLDKGLITPVIRNADEMNIVGLQRSIVDLTARARSRQLRQHLRDARDQPAAGGDPGPRSVQKEPVVVNDAIAIRSTMYLALTFDHRLIDGALADQFTAKTKAILENWSEAVM